MININENVNNKVFIQFKTNDGVKEESREFKKLVDVNYDATTPDYTCLYGNGGSWNNRFDYYLNTVLQLPESFISELQFPKIVFYHIETDKPAEDLENCKVNSIAWITEDGKEYILIIGSNGSEEEIIKEFIDYCNKNNIMGLVGHNSYKFDNKIMYRRCKEFKIHNTPFNNDCNLDTQQLAKLFTITDKELSLFDLAEKLGLEFDYKNIKNVRLCKDCFEAMNAKHMLTDLFKQSRCPLNKMPYTISLLNYYTCKYLYNKNIKITKSYNKEIRFKNHGGFNFKESNKDKSDDNEESDKLKVYNNVLLLDIVSCYPHLLMLINADIHNEYENINRETGEIKPFKKTNEVGLIGELAKMLYESRAKTKKEMELTEDKEYKKQLDYEQKAKKIIVNGLYGALDKTDGNYILKNNLIAATITKMGREILQHIINECGAVYAKTDSVFIPLKEDGTPELILNDVNIEVSKFIKCKYDLNNGTSNGQLIRFEIKEIIDKLIVKDKSNYVKIIDGEYNYTGGTFKNIGFSEYENNLVNRIFKEFTTTESNKKVIEYVKEYTEKVLKDCNNLQFFSKYIKLSDKQLNHYKMFGRFYMDNNNLPYSLNFKYLSCRVNGNEYDYIMYPKGHKPENLTINELYVYKMMIDTLKNCQIINKDTKKNLEKKYNIKKLNDKSKQIKEKYINNKNNETNIIINKRAFESINNNNIKELNNIIPDTSIYYEKGLLTFIPVRAGTKKAYNISKLKYNEEHLSKININDLIEENDNFGVVVRYKNLQVFDIDGNKTLWKRSYHQEEWDTPKINNKDIKLTDQEQEELQLLKDYIFNTFKKIDYPFIMQKSQSGGYHLLYTAPEPCNLNNIYYPEDLEITGIREEILKEIRGSAFKDSIDINVNYIVFAPSQILIDGDNREYKLLSNNYKWEQLFNNPIKDLEEHIDRVFKEDGYIVGEREEITKKHESKKQVKKENNNINNAEFKKEFLNDTELKNLFIEEHKIRTGNHNDSIREFTAILKYVGLTDGEAISYMDDVLTGANDNTTEHTNQVQAYLSENDGTKPNFKKYLHLKELIEKLDYYLNPIIDLTEGNNNKLNEMNVNNEIIDLKDGRNETDLYNTKEGSFAEYRGKILYSISPEFLYCMSLELNKLHKICSNYKEKIQNKELGLIEMITGGFYHYGLLDKDIRKILNATNITDFKEKAEKHDNLIIGFGDDKIVYGFKHLFNNCVKICNLSSDGENNQKQQANKIYNNIKSLLYKATILNPFFYATRDMYYKQEKLQLLTNSNKVLLNCAFLEIEKCEEISVNKDSDNPLKFNFKIILKNGIIKELEGYTIKELQKYLQNKALFMKQNNTTTNNFIRHFINDSLNKGDIKTIKQPYIDGFLIELNKKGEYDIYTNIETDTYKYCTIEESIEELNEIYTDIYNKDDKFIRVLYWYLIHSLRPIWIELNIGNAVLNNLMLTGKEGTGKSLCVSIMLQMFSKSIITEVGGEADTIPSVKRALKNSTLPLILDDPTFNIKDLGGLLKKTTYGTQAGGKAGDQYGDDIKKHEVARQIAITTNDPAIIKEGVNRRVWLLEYTETNIFKEEQLKALKQHSLNYKGKCKLLKLNTIIYEFSNFIKGFFKDITENEVLELSETKGVWLINEFLNHINNKSNIELHKDFFDKDLYRFEVSTIDYTQLFYKNFVYALTRGEIINTSTYDIKDLKMMLSNGHTIIQDGTHMKRRKEYGIEYIIVKWNGLEEFIKSQAGLKQPYKKEEVYKLLDLPDSDDYKFKRHKIENKQVMSLKLSVKEFYKFFLGINIQETRKANSLL